MKLGELVTYFKANTADFDRAVSHIKHQGKNLKQFGQQMSMYVSLPLAAIGGVAIKTFADFESGMNKVRAVSGATGEQFEQLSALARQLGATTKFTAKEASEGMGFLAMAGFEVEEIMSALPATLDLAAAGAMELGRSADIVSNIMKGFEKEASQTGEVADILTKTFTSSNTSLEQLGEAMSYAAPIAHGFGQSIETASAAIGIMSDAGIQSSRAGTGLGQILAILAKKSDQVGVSIFDSSGKMRDFADILEDIQKKGMTAKEVVTIFGQRAGPAMQVLLARGAEGLREFRGELEDSAGTTKTAADTMMEGIKGAFIELKSATQELMISFVGPFAKSVETAIDKVKDFVTQLSELSTGTKQIVVGVGILVAAIGPLSLVLGVLAADILPRLIKGFKLLWVTMSKNPYLLLGAALAYFVAKLIEVKTATGKAKKEQEEYNDVLLQAKQLLQDTQPIEKQMKVLSSLNKRQLETLKQRLETQISLEQDYSVDLKAELSKRLTEDEKLNKLREKYTKASSEGAVDTYLVGIANQIQHRKEAVAKELETEHKGQKQRLAQYKDYLNQVNTQIENFVEDAEDEGPVDIGLEVDTDSAEVLSKMNKELSKVNELQKLLGSEYDANAEKASIYNDTLRTLIDSGLSAQDEAVQQLASRLKNLQTAYEELESIPTPSFAVDTSKLADMKPWLKEQMEGMNEFAGKSNEVLHGIYGVAQNVFNGMQNVISDAFSGTKNVLEGFGEFFKKFIAGLIAKLIAAAIAAAVLSFILNSITGGGISGMGAVGGKLSFGSIFKGMIGFGKGGLQGLQTGGIVTKPGVFEVGEKGRETVYLPAGAAVTPNMKETKKKPQVVVFEIEGRTLAGVLKSQEKYEQSY
jgi:TP901 family phage tail tape measure protein